MYSTIAVADIPSYPVLEPDTLDGLSVGEAVRKYAFDNPLVQAARPDLATFNRTKRQHAAFNGIYERGFFLWPLNLTVGSLDGFFRPAILHDEEVRWGPLPQELEAAFAHIAGCFASVMEALQTSRIAVVDMYNKPVHSSLWRRPGITIDLTTNDLYEIGMEQWRRDNPRDGVLRRGLWLSLPNAATNEPNSVPAKSKAASPQGMPEKKMPAKKAAVIKALKKRKIMSKSDLEGHLSRTRLAAEIAGDTKQFGAGQERVEAVRVMFTRLTDADFAAK